MHRRLVAGLAAVIMFGGAAACGAQVPEPGWSPHVFASEPEQHILERLDIVERPYRPLHFYGNTVRRMYYRGNPLPTMGDMTTTSLILLPSPPPASLSGTTLPGY